MNKDVRRIPFKLEDENVFFTLVSPVEKSGDVKKIIDENHEWKAWDEENCEVLEGTARVQHKYNPNGIDLFYYQLKQKNKPKAVVFTFHGYAGSQRVDGSLVANSFANQGIEVIGFDNEGHGRNIPEKKDRCFIEDFRKLYYNGVSFIEFSLEREKERLDGVPVFLWGFSMGAAIISSILVTKEFKTTIDKISGAMISSPAIKMCQKPDWIQYQILLLTSNLFPKMMFPRGESKPVTSYMDKEKWFQEHEDTFQGVKMATGREIVRMGEYVISNWRKIRRPVLLMHGTKDNMTKFSATRKMFDSIRSKKKTFVALDDMLHGIFCDRCVTDIIDVQLQWINLRLEDDDDDEEEEEESEEEVEKGIFGGISDLSVSKNDIFGEGLMTIEFSEEEEEKEEEEEDDVE